MVLDIVSSFVVGTKNIARVELDCGIASVRAILGRPWLAPRSHVKQIERERIHAPDSV